MTTLQKQIKHINNNLFAARMENIIQYMYEDELEKQVAKVFHRMRKGILKNLKEYYSPDIMVNAHMDLILAPIHEYHKKYYDTIMKYKLREHRKGQVQGRRLVKRAKQYAKAYSKNYFGAVKADSTIPMSSIIQKDKLFATSDYSAEHMRDKTFLASENTLARVDKDINKTITDGYTDGWGINDVASNIEKRFNQLETWEARRIARTEIHGSHMQGIMQSYEEMGVEYTQWASAHDNRTRDTHSALDGEIIPFGGVYSNGLRYPGDTNGPISEWINCRCGNIPWFCPPGMMVPPGMSNFRESDLIATLDKWQTPESVLESLQKTAEPNIEGYNKYKLTDAENKLLSKLEANKDSLKFIERHQYEDLADRKEFNEMWNKILIEGGDPTDYFAIPGGEGVRYEKLFKKFKNWVPKAEIEIKPIEINKKKLFENKDSFKLSSEEKQAYKILKENSNNLSDDETVYYRQLSTKLELNKYHKKLVENGLDEYDTARYLDNYARLKLRGVDLPDVPLDLKFTTNKLRFENDYISVKIGNKFTLTNEEAAQQYFLAKKELLFSYKEVFSEEFPKAERELLKQLNKQLEFNHYYYVRKANGGLDYGLEQKYQKLFAELKDKLSLSEDLVKPVKLPEYKPHDISTNNRSIKLKGKTEDGHIPGKHTVDELFTVDITKCTPREQEVITRWLGDDYAYFRDYLTRAGRDIDEYVDFVLHADSEHLKRYGYIKNMIERGELKEAAKQIREIGLSVEHDLPILENILENNSTKKAMTLWRTEERLHMDGDLEVGKVVTFKGYNSTAISKEGAEHFAEVTHREMKWIYEIEAPSGTKGAYVAELNKNPKFAQEMEFLLDKDTEMEIVDFDKANHYIKFRIINIGAAIKSNMWNSIKNKIWGRF